MTIVDNENWEQALQDACFPVTLTDVYVGDPASRAHRYRAVVPVDSESNEDPFAIVTDRYRLIRNEDVIDLGHEAFERVFGPHYCSRMSVFNVVMAKGRGSFFADFTTPELDCNIPLPGLNALGETNAEPSRHTFFLRTVNSYNRTQAVGLEAGICRWICKNGIIFGKQSIRFRHPHDKTKQQLMDQIAQFAERLRPDELTGQIGDVYAVSLAQHMTVLEGVWQTLRLAIPPVDPESRTARLWRDRCADLMALSTEYEHQFGNTAFSVLQAASQWGQHHARTSPIQRHSYERRCGEMLESLTTDRGWPNREQNAQEQINRILGWSAI